MTTQAAPTQADTTTTAPIAPRRWRATLTLSAIGTRLSFVVLATLLLTSGTNWVRAGLVVTAEVVAYVLATGVASSLSQRVSAARVSFVAESVAALLVASMAFFFTTALAIGIVAFVLGAVRAAADVALQSLTADAAAVVLLDDGDEDTARPREGLTLAAILLGAGVIGAGVAWLGPAGGLWLLALVYAVCAARVVLSTSTAHPRGLADPAPVVEGVSLERPVVDPAHMPAQAAPEPLPSDLQAAAVADQAEPPTVATLVRTPSARSTAVVLAVTSLLGFAGAVTLIASWVNHALPSTDGIGIIVGAYLVGALGTAVVFAAAAAPPLRYFALAGGFTVGAAVVALLNGLQPTQLLLVAAAFVDGIAMSSVTPVITLSPSPALAANIRGRVEMLLTTVIGATIVAGAFGAAWLTAHASLMPALTTAAACYLIAMLVPVVVSRFWHRLTPAVEAPVTVLRRSPRLAARLAVTLAYADGEWLVEVRKGRSLLGSRHIVKSAEAMNMLSLLGVPALSNRVEEALSTDKTEAARQVERMRSELAELEAKLSRLNEMADLTEEGRP